MTPQEAIQELKDASDNEVRYGDTRHHYNEVMKRVEAFELAIKALEQTRWIPVSERLPELPENRWDNFIVTEKVHTLNCVIIEVDTEPFFNGHFQSNTEVIAWMPLPKPYEAESEE